MPGGPTSHGKDRMLNAASGDATVSSATQYVHLLEADPGFGAITVADLNPIDTAGYAAQTVTWGTLADGTGIHANKRVLANSVAITFTFSAVPETATWIAVSVGNTGTDLVVWRWNITDVTGVSASDTYSLPIGALVMRVNHAA